MMSLKLAISQRPAIVSADVIDAKKLATHMQQDNHSVLDLQRDSARIWNARCDRYFDEIGHILAARG